MTKPMWLKAADVVSCPSWCGGNHDDEEHPVDRRHYSTWDLQFEPVLAEPTFRDFGPDHGGVMVNVVELTVGMDQGYREVAPQISVTPTSTDHGCGFAFTVTEAEQVAHALLKLVKQARGDAQ